MTGKTAPLGTEPTVNKPDGQDSSVGHRTDGTNNPPHEEAAGMPTGSPPMGYKFAGSSPMGYKFAGEPSTIARGCVQTAFNPSMV
jgi:hypothetical protein